MKVQKVRQKPDRLHQQKQVPHRQRPQKTHRRKMPEFRNMMRQENRSMQKRRREKKNTSTGIFIGMGVVIAIVVTGAAWYMLVYRKKKN